jgi:4a-hydroxytetrahydrobiopterin dehydratase
LETNLKERTCTELKNGAKPLGGLQILPFIKLIPKGWMNNNNEKISKSFTFDSFKDSIRFAHNVACIADVEGHCPDICICGQKVDIILHTLSVGGLTENDFIMAAKIESIKTK